MKETWLAPYDFSASSFAAAHEAARLLAPQNGVLELFHVHPIEHPGPYGQTGEELYQREKKLRDNLRQVADGLVRKHPSLEVTIEVIPGDPSTAIIAEADRIGAAHIVMGTHGRTGIAHLVLGSVAEKVVHASKVAVSVIKEART